MSIKMNGFFFFFFYSVANQSKVSLSKKTMTSREAKEMKSPSERVLFYRNECLYILIFCFVTFVIFLYC